METNKNIYWKISEARAELQKVELKKSGFNKYSNYYYHELSDFLPTINKINAKLGLFSMVEIDNQVANLLVINCDIPEERVIFTVPSTSIEMKGSNTAQAIGAVQTYMKKYLYSNFYEISENDIIDSAEQTDKPKEVKASKDNKKPKVEKESTGDDLETLKNEVTELCKEVSLGGDRAKVAEIVKANNNNNMNPKSITDIGVAKKILEELKAIQ